MVGFSIKSEGNAGYIFEGFADGLDVCRVCEISQDFVLSSWKKGITTN